MKTSYLVLLGWIAAFSLNGCESNPPDVDLMEEYQAQVLMAKEIVETKEEESTFSDQDYHYLMMKQLGKIGSIWEQMVAMCVESDECAEGGGMSSHLDGEQMGGGHMGGAHMSNYHMMTPGQMLSMNEIEVHMNDEMEVFEHTCLVEEGNEDPCEVYQPYHLDYMGGLLDIHLDICQMMMGDHMDHG